MTLAEKQSALVGRYSIIQDPQERLAAVISRGKKATALTEVDKTEANRVTGCQSAAWVVGAREGDVMRYRCDADSPLVKGLIALFCEFYDGAEPAEILGFQDALLEDMGLVRLMSGTRLHGVKSVRAKIKEWALTLSA
jgi:cysteine desulfuration protein SufE